MAQHTMSLREQSFNQIKSGKKTLELRIFDDKRQKLNLGDIIVFSKFPEKQETISVRVVGLSRFKTFRDLYECLDGRSAGRSDKATIDEMLTETNPYPKEEEQHYGVLGIHVKLIPQ